MQLGGCLSRLILLSCFARVLRPGPPQIPLPSAKGRSIGASTLDWGHSDDGGVRRPGPGWLRTQYVQLHLLKLP